MSKQEKTNQDELLPDINSYLESLDNKQPVSVQELDHLIDIVVAKTSLNEDAAKVVVRLFFQEIRNALLRNECVTLRGLGNFQVSSPNSSGNKIRVFPKFKPSPLLVRRLNDDR